MSPKNRLPISVLLVDSNATFLRIAAGLLQEHYHEELQIVGTSQGDNDAIQQLQQHRPRIVLIGLGQHSLSALQLIPRVKALLPDAGIIVLGSLDIQLYRQAALDAGAHAFIAKVALNNELLSTIQHILDTSPAPIQESRAVNGKKPDEHPESEG